MKRFIGIWLVLQVLLVGACTPAAMPEPASEPAPGPVTPAADPDPEEPSAPSGAPFTLTVATCNLLKPEGRRTEMSMTNNTVRMALARSIKATQADLIGFNELDETFVPGGIYSLPAACSLEGFSWSLNWPNAPHTDREPTYSYANGFAFNKNILTLEDSGCVWLSAEEANTWYETPEKAYGNAGSPARTCVWARLRHKATQKVFWLFVTHLPTKSQGPEPEGTWMYNMAGVVNSFAASKAGDAPAILTGDMNCSPSMTSVGCKAAYRRLFSYWTDANADSSLGTQSGSSASYYYPVETFTKNHPERRIDHIMTRGCSIADYRTIVTTYTYGGKDWCPSDHLPLVATVTIE